MAVSSDSSPEVRDEAQRLFAMPRWQARQEVEVALQAPTAPPLDTLLKSCWKFFEASRIFGQGGDLARCQQLFVEAAEGFQGLGLTWQQDLALGFGFYCSGIAAPRRFDGGAADQLFTQASRALAAAGEYTSNYQDLLAQLDADHKLVGAFLAVVRTDPVRAGTLLNDAAQDYFQLADRYYAGEPAAAATMRGAAYLLKAMNDSTQAQYSFSAFAFDRIGTGETLAENARNAVKHLEAGDRNPMVFGSALHLARSLAGILQVTGEVSQIMQRVFHASFKADVRTLGPLKQWASEARREAEQAGEQGMGYVHYCDILADQVANLERQTRTSPVDFGIYSGLISSALFLPLFLLMAWANLNFHMGLGEVSLDTTPLVLALVGGFGYGALKFTPLVNRLGSLFSGGKT